MKIKVGSKVKIGDFSGAVLSNDYSASIYSCPSSYARDEFVVTHVDMILPSYDIIPGQKRVNNVVLRSVVNENFVVFSRASMLEPIYVKKYRVLYTDFAEPVVSTDYYETLQEFKVCNQGLKPLCLILETEINANP